MYAIFHINHNRNLSKKLDIFPLLCVDDKAWILELTLIHKNIKSACTSLSVNLT
jgi:hypothetical protein